MLSPLEEFFEDPTVEDVKLYLITFLDIETFRKLYGNIAIFHSYFKKEKIIQHLCKHHNIYTQPCSYINDQENLFIKAYKVTSPISYYRGYRIKYEGYSSTSRRKTIINTSLITDDPGAHCIKYITPDILKNFDAPILQI